tara:strand:+ start:274 stop:1179 length:906 start_codon:yes stop_codon:yes gene_type:complete
MPINASPHFYKAQAEYLQAETTEQKIKALKKMISQMPGHKGAEALRKQLKRRLAKLKYTKEKKEKKSKQGKEGIRKQGVQVVLCGLTNSGKSSLLSTITNAKPIIADYEFTTKQPILGNLVYKNISFQIIDMPAINHETFEQGLANTADILLIIITSLEELKEIEPFLIKSLGKKIIIYNKSDLLTKNEKRKLEATLKTKKYNFIILSTKTKSGVDNLKQKLIEQAGVIRIYTKQPHKPHDPDPIIVKPETTIQQLGEKVLKKGIKIKEIRITGPSSKFPNQKIGLKHKLKDKDIVEFHTK